MVSWLGCYRWLSLRRVTSHWLVQDIAWLELVTGCRHSGHVHEYYVIAAAGHQVGRSALRRWVASWLLVNILSKVCYRHTLAILELPIRLSQR